MIEEFYDWIIAEINTNLSVDVYAPQLPIETGKAVAVRVEAGDTIDKLCQAESYSEVRFTVITRDANNRGSIALAESIKNLISNRYNVSLTSYTISSINGDVPLFTDVDENNQVYYNTLYRMNIG